MENHGLDLDRCAGSCDKTGTSTTGEQGRGFFSEEIIKTLENIIPEKYREQLMCLHLQLSVILRVISYTGQIDVDAFQKLCLDFSYNVIQNFSFAWFNHTLHATVHHAPELIIRNDGYSLGSLSEEGLEANNKDIRNYLLTHCRKTSPIHKLNDVMNRLLERSHPLILQCIESQHSQKHCTECGSKDHTIRSHSRKMSSPNKCYDSLFLDMIL